MGKVWDGVRREIREAIPPAIFFFFAFQLLAFTKSLMLREYGVDTWTFVGTTVGALVVAKVVLIADHLPFVNKFPTKPLIYNVVWKTMIYYAASFVVRYIEHLIHFWRKSGSFEGANRMIIEEIVWPHFWAVMIWLLVLLLAYCTIREFQRVVGPERVRRMFFGPLDAGGGS